MYSSDKAIYLHCAIKCRTDYFILNTLITLVHHWYTLYFTEMTLTQFDLKTCFWTAEPNPQFISSNIFFKSTITSPCFLNFSHVFVRDYLLVPILVSFCLYLLLGCWFWWSVYKDKFPVLVLSLLAMLMFLFFKYAFFLRLFDGVVYFIFIAMIFWSFGYLLILCQFQYSGTLSNKGFCPHVYVQNWGNTVQFWSFWFSHSCITLFFNLIFHFCVDFSIIFFFYNNNVHCTH